MRILLTIVFYSFSTICYADIATGFVGWWKFDDGSGASAIDSSGNANTGTLENSPAWIAGRIGPHALSFNGANNDVVTTNNQGNGSTLDNFTISVWFNTTTASGCKIVGLESSQTGTGSVNYDRNTYMGTDGKIYFGAYNGSTVVVASLGALTDGKWHNAIGVCTSGTSLQLYIDGVLQNTVAFGGTAYNSYVTSYWRIGSYALNSWPQGVNGYFSGSIDDVRIYNRPLSAADVAQLYNVQSTIILNKAKLYNFKS